MKIIHVTFVVFLSILGRKSKLIIDTKDQIHALNVIYYTQNEIKSLKN